MGRVLAVLGAVGVLTACGDSPIDLGLAGSLEVIVKTTGDGEGDWIYGLSVDDGDRVISFGEATSLTFDLDTGSHVLELTGAPGSCVVDENPVNIVVASEAPVSVTFVVDCA